MRRGERGGEERERWRGEGKVERRGGEGEKGIIRDRDNGHGSGNGNNEGFVRLGEDRVSLFPGE